MSHGVLSATFSITRPGSKRSAIWCWHLSLGNCHNRTFHPGNSVLGWAEGREGQNGCIHQESGSLKQKHFVCLDDLSKVPQVHFQLLDIGDQLIDYAGPSLSTNKEKKGCVNTSPASPRAADISTYHPQSSPVHSVRTRASHHPAAQGTRSAELQRAACGAANGFACF